MIVGNRTQVALTWWSLDRDRLAQKRCAWPWARPRAVRRRAYASQVHAPDLYSGHRPDPRRQWREHDGKSRRARPEANGSCSCHPRRRRPSQARGVAHAPIHVRARSGVYERHAPRDGCRVPRHSRSSRRTVGRRCPLERPVGLMASRYLTAAEESRRLNR